MRDSSTGLVAYKLAKKYAAAEPTARPMVNAYLSAEEHAVFASLPANLIRKRRYAVDQFSVDIFEGDLTGLVLAEIEQATSAALTVVGAPQWAVREVTHDARFQGGSLATLTPPDLAKLLK
jgi:CYTH domain-containing protein